MALSTISAALILLSVLSVAVRWILVAIRRLQFSDANGCRPMRRRGWDPLLGLDVLFKLKNASDEKRLLSLHSQFCERYSATHVFNKLWLRAYFTAEPENVKAILATQFGDFELGRRRNRCFEPALGTAGLFNIDGLQWRNARALMRPSFTQSQAAELDSLEVHVLKFLSNIPQDGSTVDLQELFFRFTMDSATEFLFGTSIGSLDQNTLPTHHLESIHAFDYHFYSVFRRILLGNMIYLDPSRDDRRHRQTSETIRGFADVLINRALANQKRTDKNGDGVDATETTMKMQLFETLARSNKDRSEMRDHLLTILAAARDTTAAFLGSMWFEIARRPDVFSKMKHEVNDLQGMIPTADRLKKMVYLNQVIKETLRMHPPLPFTLRAAKRDTTIPRGGGPDGSSPVFVPKGQEISIGIHTMHHRKDLWGEDADEFKPERWEDIRPGWEYLPFGGGPRVCIGQHRAIMEGSYLTIRLLQSFKGIENRDNRPWEELLRVSLSSANGVKVGFIPF